MKNKIKLLLVFGVALSTLFASCDGDDENPECDETFIAEAGPNQFSASTTVTLAANDTEKVLSIN